MKKFKVIQASVATAMAFSMLGLTACDLLFGEPKQGDGQTYRVTLNANGGTPVSELSYYVSGEETTLPDAQKDHYDLVGWYAYSDFSGNPVTAIPKSQTGDVEYYAKWQPQSYALKYFVEGAPYTESAVASYTYNENVTLPQPTRENYSLDGWYGNPNYDGTPVTSIAAGEYGAKEYYARWTPDSYTVTLNLDGGKLGSGVTCDGYSYGTEKILPVPTKNDYRFDGWFDNQNCSGNAVAKISAGETGNKTYWAKWTLTAEINVKAYGGYEEGAFAEVVPANKVTIGNLKVSYKKSSASAYTEIDNELIREMTGANGEKYIRADLVGLSAGEYSLKISADGSESLRDVTVTAYDRSGYAFYNRTAYATTTSANVGVGGYKDDGTPKTNAKIIYVTEQTKNTVTAKFGSSTYTGIGNILTYLYKSSDPVIVRIIGRIAAATWKEIEYNPDKVYNPSNKMPETLVKGANGLQLPTTDTSSTLTQAALIAGNYNELDESEYSELKGLSSKATYSSGAYDSCWNDCAINSGAHDVTVEGIGADAELFQWGMTWKQASSVEVRNLTFTDYTEDACSFQGDTNEKNGTISKFNSYWLWLHNCTFNRGKNYWDVSDEQDKHDGDGSSDLKLVYGVTLSYNHYINTHKTGLVGAGDTSHSYNVTFHHNYYEGCESRMPLARLANMHMYNNYYKNSSGTNMSLRTSAFAFIEGCYFENANNPVTVNDSTAIAKIWNCEFVKVTTGALTEKANQIVNVTSRNATITNSSNNNPYKNFDTGSTNFYLNAYTATSAQQAKTDCIEKSGAHKN